MMLIVDDWMYDLIFTENIFAFELDFDSRMPYHFYFEA